MYNIYTWHLVLNKLSYFIDKHKTVDDYGVYDVPNMDNTSTCNSNLSIDIIMCMNTFIFFML